MKVFWAKALPHYHTYLKLYVEGHVDKHGKKQKTSTIKNNNNPVWFETFKFTEKQWPKGKNLFIDLKTVKTFGSNPSVARVQLKWPIDPSGCEMGTHKLKDIKHYEGSVDQRLQLAVCDMDVCKEVPADTMEEIKLKKKGLSKAQKKLKQYEIGADLGEGAFGVVKLGVRKSDGKRFALKYIKQENKDDVESEVEVLEMVKDENVVHLQEIIETPEQLIMVMEILEGGDMEERLNKKKIFSEREAAHAIKHTARAIAYLHQLGVTHRDVKPENMMYETTAEDSILKITDFGFSKYQGGHKMKTGCGTGFYIAPEIANKRSYGPSVDVWAMGATLYQLLCGYPPFYSDNEEEMFMLIRRARFVFEGAAWQEVSEEAKELIRKMCKYEPDQRICPRAVDSEHWVNNPPTNQRTPIPVIEEMMKIMKDDNSLSEEQAKKMAAEKLGISLDTDAGPPGDEPPPPMPPDDDDEPPPPMPDDDDLGLPPGESEVPPPADEDEPPPPGPDDMKTDEAPPLADEEEPPPPPS